MQSSSIRPWVHFAFSTGQDKEEEEEEEGEEAREEDADAREEAATSACTETITHDKVNMATENNTITRQA